MIECRDITKVFNKNTRKEACVLKNANLTLPDTGFVFIVGRSGIGKSTILNAIGGLISYDGEILYDGEKVNIETYRRENIGYIFQDFLLFDDVSIRNNIKVGLNLAGIYDENEISNRVSALLKAVRLNVNSARNAGALSQGQKQRVAIARTLAINPKIILADEPTGNVDSINSLQIMKILKSLSKNHLIVCVTHNKTLVNRFADLAFSIEDRDFVPCDPKKLEIDEEYLDSTSVIVEGSNTNKLLPTDVVLRVFKDEKDGSTVKMVKRGEQIIYIDDKIKTNTTQRLNQDNLPVDIDTHEVINVDFERRQEKQTFKQFIKDLSLISQMKESNKKKKKKKKKRNFTRVALPCLLLLFLDIFFYFYRGSQNSVGNQSYTNQVVLSSIKTETDSSTLSYNNKDILKIISDEESGIIEDPSFIPTYRTVSSSTLSNLLSASQEYISLNCAYRSYVLTENSFSNSDVVNESITFFNSKNNNSSLLSGLTQSSTQSLDSSTLSQLMTSSEGLGTSNSTSEVSQHQLNAYFYSLDRAKELNISPTLNNLPNLKDDEVILDYNWVKENLKIDSIDDAKKKMVGESITLTQDNALTAYVSKDKLVIKDIVSTPLFAIYTSEKIANKYTFSYMQEHELDNVKAASTEINSLLNTITSLFTNGGAFNKLLSGAFDIFGNLSSKMDYGSSVNHNRYYDLGSLKDVEIVNYSDIVNNSDYEISLPSGVDLEKTFGDLRMNYKGSSSNEDDSAYVQDFNSFCLFSDSFKDEIVLSNLNGSSGYDFSQFGSLADFFKLFKIKNKVNVTNDGEEKSDSNTETTKDYSAYASLGNFALTCKNGKVIKKSEPDKKIICFYDNLLKDSEGQFIDSKEMFLSRFVQSNLVFNSSSVIPDNIKGSIDNLDDFNNGQYMLIPNSLANLFKDSSKDNININLRLQLGWLPNNNDQIKIYGTYEGGVDDTIYVSKTGFNYLRGYLPSTVTRSYNFSKQKSSMSDIASAYDDYQKSIEAGCPNIFISNNINKTVDYLNKNYSEMHSFDFDASTNTYYTEYSLLMARVPFIFIIIVVAVIALTSVLDAGSKVNSEKYYFGVLRSIGKSRGKIIGESLFSTFTSLILQAGISTAVFAIILRIFNLFYVGWVYWLFLLGFIGLTIITELLFMLGTLAKKPNNIIRSVV